MIIGYFGLPGSGKSTMLARYYKKYGKKYHRVYSTHSIKGCYKLDFKDLGKYDFSNSLILLDEISLDADNRDYKSFTNDLKKFFILHRHYACDIVWCSQYFDGVDKKIRGLTSELYYMRKLFCFTVTMKIKKILHVDNEKQCIQEGEKLPSLLGLLFGGMHFIYRPLYYKYFDSFEKILLPKYQSELW